MAFLLAVVGCGKAHSERSHPSVMDSAGVAIWSFGDGFTNSTSTPVRVGEFSLPDSGWTVEADGVAVDPAGNRVYVLDEFGPRVLVFTLEGAWIGEIGRPGEGPGEYAMPVGVDVDALGIVKIVDASRSLLLSWGRDGRFLGQERLPVPYWGPGFKVAQGVLVYVRGDQDGETGSVTEALVRSDGEVLSELMTLRQPWVPVSTPCGNIPVPKVMAPSITWGANAQYVVAATWPDYEIQVFDGDSLVASLRRDTPSLRVTESEAEKMVATGPHSFLIESCGMSPAGVLRAAGFVDQTSPIDRIAVDPFDRIWAQTNSSTGSRYRIELWDLETGYLGSLPASAFPVAFISEDRFLAVSEHDWGSSVEVWRIEEG